MRVKDRAFTAETAVQSEFGVIPPSTRRFPGSAANTSHINLTQIMIHRGSERCFGDDCELRCEISPCLSFASFWIVCSWICTDRSQRCTGANSLDMTVCGTYPAARQGPPRFSEPGNRSQAISIQVAYFCKKI